MKPELKIDLARRKNGVIVARVVRVANAATLAGKDILRGLRIRQVEDAKTSVRYRLGNIAHAYELVFGGAPCSGERITPRRAPGSAAAERKTDVA